MGLQAYGYEDISQTVIAQQRRSVLKKSHWILIIPMLLFLGAMTNVGYSHLSVHITSQGFSSHITALSITVSGIMLTLGKFVYGWSSDKVGTYKSNWIFGIILIAGLILNCTMNDSVVLLFLAMCSYGIGLATTTVGLTAWAGDLSNTEDYDNTVRRFQLGYAAGTLIFSSLPGILADFFEGSYRPAYIFFTFCAVFVLLSVQWIYNVTGQSKIVC